MPRQLALALVALLVAAGSGACRVQVTGGIDVGSNGHGSVRAAVALDDQAVKAVGDLRTGLRVDDLRRTGWRVEGPRREADGLTWVRAWRPFSGVAEAVQALSQLSGPDGPFRDLTLRRTRSLLHSRTSLSGSVDLTDGLAGFADSDLRAKVGDALPLDVAGLGAELGADPDRVFSARFEARLPGSARSNATGRSGTRLVWQPSLGERVAVEATSTDLNRTTIALVAVVVLAAAVCAGGWLVWRRRGVN